ncbi:site-specific DNA-methyltransferase [Treponema putidum]|uniref:site-specific DNA-methyltransferase n=1 Tax=Treponema putidum TaxID=221027 RepID=UPI0021049070|nr:site-specific DNA-methyltransferase [Treponema putidum]UTY31180.1 site-specific DNA-methyltransferase [Treponema putidum]
MNHDLNTVIFGDSCEELKKIPDSSVNLVYLDPPFFSQKEHELSSRSEGKVYSFDDKFSSKDEYISFMSLVLNEIKRVLTKDGSIFLHCDRYASHYLREELDKVFGEVNFQSEIIWAYKRWSNSKKGLLNAHQNIYFYSKTKDFKFNQFYTEYSPSTNIDQILQKRVRNSKGKSEYKRDVKGDVVFTTEKKGVPLSDVWEIPFLNPKAKERCGYPTQKPVKLLQRIIELVTNEGDIVLDPFCGSGTTCVAAKSLNRKFIGIDKNTDAIEISKKRLSEMIISESGVLAKGIDSYIEKNSFESTLLFLLNAIPVQRNKGIDGFIKNDNSLIPIKIQKDTETIDDAITNLENAVQGKNFPIKILIQTNEKHTVDFFKRETDVKVIKYVDLQIKNLLNAV